MKITKEGSGLFRWALVERLRLVGNSPKWAALFARLMHRSGKAGHRGAGQEALCVLYAMLRTSTPYRSLPRRLQSLPTTGKKLVGHRLRTRPQPWKRRLPGQLARGWSGRRLQTRPQPWKRRSSDNWQEVGLNLLRTDHNPGGDGSSDTGKKFVGTSILDRLQPRRGARFSNRRAEQDPTERNPCESDHLSSEGRWT